MSEHAIPETGGPAKRADRLFRYVRITFELAVVVTFVFLLYQNAELRRRPLTARPRLDRFAAGDTVPTLKVFDESGKASTLDLRNRTLLLLGDPSCPSCAAHVKELGAEAVLLSVADRATTQASSFAAFRGRLYSLAAMPSDPRFRRVPQLLVIEQRRVVRTCADSKDCL